MSTLSERMPRPAPGELPWRLASSSGGGEPIGQELGPRQRFEALASELAVGGRARPAAHERKFDWRHVGPWAARAWAGVFALQATVALVTLGVLWLSLAVVHATPHGVGQSSHVNASSNSAIDNHVVAPPPVQAPAQAAWLVWPAIGRISQPMWAGHPNGIDVAIDSRTPIRAIADGQVLFAGGDPCCVYGQFIIVQHADGWTSLYAHLSVLAVKAGEQVHQSELIGLSGATGHVSGPHLHFELRQNGRPVDPLDYLAPPSAR
jgi:murein DD-endopeptidase MepM/ murein hydrolase activator NlpD